MTLNIKTKHAKKVMAAAAENRQVLWIFSSYSFAAAAAAIEEYNWMPWETIDPKERKNHDQQQQQLQDIDYNSIVNSNTSSSFPSRVEVGTLKIIVCAPVIELIEHVNKKP